jgi:hypothetical protein
MRLHVEVELIPTWDEQDGQTRLIELRFPKTQQNILPLMTEGERLQAELSLQHKHEQSILEKADAIRERGLTLGQYRSPRTGM